MIYLYAIAAAFVWVQVLRSPIVKVKPFTCDVCLTGWLCMALSIVAGNYWQAPFDAALAMVGMIFFKKLMQVN